jgi:hypothetical protein
VTASLVDCVEAVWCDGIVSRLCGGCVAVLKTEGTPEAHGYTDAEIYMYCISYSMLHVLRRGTYL